MGVGGVVFNVTDGFTSVRVQRIVVDDVHSEDVKVDFDVPWDNVLGSLLFSLYKSDLSMIFQNSVVGYAELTQYCLLKFTIQVIECHLYHLLIEIFLALVNW